MQRECYNEKGESILMVLISILALGGLIMVVAPYMLGSNKSNHENLVISQVCRESAQNIMAAIQSNGVQTKAFRVPIGRESLFLDDSKWHEGKYLFNKEGVQSEEGSFSRLGGTRWPHKKVIYWSKGIEDFKVNTPLLIQSSVNALLSVYNSSEGFACHNEKGISLTKKNGLAKLLPQNLNENFNVTASLRIRPYNRETGEVLSCIKDLKIRPYALAEPPSAQREKIIDFGDYRPDRGLEAEVFVRVQGVTRGRGEVEADSLPKFFDCSLKDRFQFGVYSVKPKQPEVSVSASEIKISIPPEDHDPGTHVACRTQYSIFGGSGDSFGVIRSSQSTWLPCDRLDICGVVKDGTVDQARGEITYKGSVPSKCLFNIYARTFDVAGNLSSSTGGVTCYGSSCSRTPMTPFTPTIDPSDSDTGTGYSVGGVEFETKQAAEIAAKHTDFKVMEIGDIPVGKDAEMKSFDSNINQSLDTTASVNAQNANVQDSITGADSVGSAQSAVDQAGQAVADAQEAVSAAQEAVSAAESMRPSELADALSEKAKEAKKAAEEALAEAKRLAEEARRKLEEEKRKEEDDDD